MAYALKLLAVFAVFACFFYSGHAQAQCTLSNIMVSQNGTGGFIHGQPEFEVLITNNCICQQSEVKLNIQGFQTTEAVDPMILDSDGFLNNKMPVPSNGVKFNYAASSKFPFTVISSQISCS